MKRLSTRCLSFLLAVILLLTSMPSIVYSSDDGMISLTPEQIAELTGSGNPEDPDVVTEDDGNTEEPEEDPEDEFVFIEPGRENDEPIGEVITTDQGYRIQMNPDMESYTIIEYLGSQKHVVIPSEYEGLPITRIASYAFTNKVALQTVQIPETIDRMEEGVFDGCNALQYNTYENGKYLGSESNDYYYYCGPVDNYKAIITEGTMHPDTKIVAAFAFRGCSALRSVVVPDGIKQVGYGMVFNCALESITLPFVGELGTDRNPQFGWAFGARSIGGNISYVPLSLKNVVITGGTDGKQGTIVQGAFYGVDMIENITLPFLGGSVSNTENAFIAYYWGAKNYDENILPVSIQCVTLRGGNIAKYAFSGCTGMTNLIISNGVTSIGQYAFDSCIGLVSVTIPESVTSIYRYAFNNCSNLETVYISDLGAWCKIDFVTSLSNPMCYANNLCLDGILVNDLEIPSSVTSIGDYAFYRCSNLFDITIPEGVISIGDYAFHGCNNLCSVTIPKSITSIGRSAFSECDSLYKVTNKSDLVFQIASSNNGYIAYYARILIDHSGGVTYKNSDSGYEYFETADGFLFEKHNNMYTLIAYLGNLDVVSLPCDINGETYKISNMRGGRNIIVPGNISSLDDCAFYGCTSIKNITISEGITTIGKSAFESCNSLVSITIPSSVISIGDNAFFCCNSLNEVHINSLESWCKIEFNFTNNPLYYEADLYFNDKMITDLNIPLGVVSINNCAFYRCSSLTSITIPSSVTSIGDYAFHGCNNLCSVTISDGVISIGNGAFYNCSSLNSVTIPESLTSIDYSAFEKCSKLENVYINNLIAWCNIWFDGSASNPLALASNLYIDDILVRNITVPEQIMSLNSSVFYAPYAVDTITLVGAKNWNSDAFSPNIVIEILGDSYYKVEDGIVYGDGVHRANAVIDVCGNYPNNIVIPEGITSIGRSAFSGCINLKSVIIPESVTSIDSYAFSGCINLESVIIPEGVTSIHTGAFLGCSSLKSINIPESVTWIYSYAFSDCSSLESVIIPEGVTSIDRSAFSGCINLKSVIIPESVTSIDSYAFSDCSSLESVIISDGVTSIGYCAFESCSSLSSITIPKSMKSIESYAFSGCRSLYKVTNNSDLLFQIGNSDNGYVVYYARVLIDREGNVFYDNSSIEYIETNDGFLFEKKEQQYTLVAYTGSLDTVTLPSCINGMNYKIRNMQGVRNVIIPETMKSIDDYAFSDCSSLKSITFPDILMSIGKYAFSGCSGLEIIKIDSLEMINEYTFYNCKNLKQIIYQGEMNEWRHILKSSTWDAGMSDYVVVCSEDTGIWYETNEARTEFYISGVDERYAVVTPPERYSGRPVVAVLSNAFGENALVQSIFLPESIVYIGKNAFTNCVALTNIQFPEGIKKLEQGVLRGCNALKSLNLPFLGNFKNDETNSYLSYTFGGNSYLDNASSVPKTLINVIVKNGAKIVDHAFENCVSLEYVMLPDEAIQVGDYVFSGCTELQDVSLPIKLEKIGNYAFSGCNNLETLIFPDSVTTVGIMILDGCNNLTEITIGAGLGYDGIADTHDQQNGNPLFGLDKSASRLNTYKVQAGNPDFVVRNNILYRKLDVDGQPVEVEIVDAPAKANLSNYDMPEGIVKIGTYAFAYNNTLRTIDLNYVRMVGNNAFYKAENLIYAQFGVAASYPLPDGVADICYNQFVGKEAFAGCTSLQRVNLDSEMLLGIDEGAFADCKSLAKINLGKNIQYVGIGAFGSSGSGAPVLKQITVDAGNTHFESIEGVLYEINSDGTLTLLVYPSMSSTYTVQNGKNIFYVPSDYVTGIESYAFRMAQNLDEIYLMPEQEMRVGDYAFANTMLERVHIGENVVSLGLKRGEGEYTIFAECNYLVAIEVAEKNKYYSSQDGVLLNKNSTRLIKYPPAKNGNLYVLPDSVNTIASMAFKNNDDLQYVQVCSQINTVGLEAFYGCSSLAMIFFDHVYAPTSVLENAFTTYDGLNENHTFNPRTLLGYSKSCYHDGVNGEYGWNNYEDVYNITPCEALPDSEGHTGDDFYAIVVVDSNGNRIANMHVSLTDPHGVTETVTTGSNQATAGVSLFYDLFGSVGMGFALDFENPYTLTVSDPAGEYATFTNPSLYLDEEMLITYITLTSMPSAYGVNCGDTDMNSQRVEVNKAEYDGMAPVFDYETGKLQYDADGNIVEELIRETLLISAIGYCDTRAGYAFVDAQGNVLDARSGLYQNDIKVADVSYTESSEGGTLFYFEPEVYKLANETDLEVRLYAVSGQEGASTLPCKTVLNIRVFDFSVSEEDVNLDMDDINVDVSKGGSIFTTLFGGKNFNLSLGKNVDLSIDVADDLITIELEGQKKGKKNKEYHTAKEGYEDNIGAHNANSYFFQYHMPFKDKDGKRHTLTYNIRFARGTEKDGYYYFRCLVYYDNNTKDNELMLYYGVVNKSLLSGGSNVRAFLKPKAYLIMFTHYGCLLTKVSESDKGLSMSDVKKLGESAQYTETILKRENAPTYSSKSNWEVSLSGNIVLKYIGNGQFQPVSSQIKGEVAFSYTFNGQTVIWVIPVTMEVTVSVNGKVEIELKFDENRKVEFEELLLTLQLDISAKVGVGCKAISGGIYGKVGTVFVLEILPEFGIDSWKISGELGAYVKVLWYEKKFRFTPDSWADGYYIIAPKNDSNTATGAIEYRMMSVDTARAAMYLVENYEAISPEALAENYELILIDGELYRLCYVDVQGMQDENGNEYDAYNYIKLALSKWENDAWSTPVILDNNGKNDTSYMLYQDGEQLTLVYTQQSKTMTEANFDDTYEAAQDLVIKSVVLSGNTLTGAQVITPIAARENYVYMTQYAVVNGVPTVVWAENADNNMFGVSPYNYIEDNNQGGEAHIFQTKANSLWMSQLVDGQWTTPSCLVSGLSAVTQIAVNDGGSVAYIVDENGNLGDTEDRVMYYGALGNTCAAFVDNNAGRILHVEATDNGFVYYYDEVYVEGEPEDDGWYNIVTAPGSRVQTLPQNAPADFVSVYDENGTLQAIVYSQNKQWTQYGETVEGSAMYAIFCENGVWGEPVEISAFTPVADRFAYYYSAVIRDDQLYLTVSTMQVDGGDAQTCDCAMSLGAVLKAGDVSVDYEMGTATFTVTNVGSVATCVYVTVDDGNYILITDALLSGASVTYTVPIPQNGQVKHTITLATNQYGSNRQDLPAISMNYSDLHAYVKQIRLGKSDVLLLAVKNTGNMTNTGLTVVRAGNYETDQIISAEVLTAIAEHQLKDGEITCVSFVNSVGKQEYFIVVQNTLVGGEIVQYEIAVDGIANHFTVTPGAEVSAYTLAKEDTESDLSNNYAYLTYNDCTGILAEDESVEVVTKLDAVTGIFDPKKDETLSIGFATGTGNTVSVVKLNGEILFDGYTVTMQNATGTLIVDQSVLPEVGGEYTLEVTFADGTVCSYALKVVSYYTVTWMDDGKELQKDEALPEGTIPSFKGDMVREPEKGIEYTFAGWDMNGDGVADKMHVVDGNYTYVALWTKSPCMYEVTWQFMDAEGDVVSVSGMYEYNTTPFYKGNAIPTPSGKVFVDWDRAIVLVTEDCTYVATYTVYHKGDVNGDDEVNSKDLVMIQQYLLGTRELTEEQLAYCNVYEDYDSNGMIIINSKDLVLLNQYILGLVVI